MRPNTPWTHARYRLARFGRRLEILASPALGAATYLGVLLTSGWRIVAQLIVLIMTVIFIGICIAVAGLMSWDVLTR